MHRDDEQQKANKMRRVCTSEKSVQQRIRNCKHKSRARTCSLSLKRRSRNRCRPPEAERTEQHKSKVSSHNCEERASAECPRSAHNNEERDAECQRSACNNEERACTDSVQQRRASEHRVSKISLEEINWKLSSLT